MILKLDFLNPYLVLIERYLTSFSTEVYYVYLRGWNVDHWQLIKIRRKIASNMQGLCMVFDVSISENMFRTVLLRLVKNNNNQG